MAGGKNLKPRRCCGTGFVWHGQPRRPRLAVRSRVTDGPIAVQQCTAGGYAPLRRTSETRDWAILAGTKCLLRSGAPRSSRWTKDRQRCLGRARVRAVGRATASRWLRWRSRISCIRRGIREASPESRIHRLRTMGTGERKGGSHKFPVSGESPPRNLRNETRGKLVGSARGITGRTTGEDTEFWTTRKPSPSNRGEGREGANLYSKLSAGTR